MIFMGRFAGQNGKVRYFLGLEKFNELIGWEKIGNSLLSIPLT